MPAPTLIQYGQTAWTGSGAKNVTGMAWNTGDLIVVIGGDETGTTAVAAPTNANLAFAAGTIVGADSSHCWGNTWTATAANTQSAQTIAGAGASALVWGMAVWVFRGHGGIGNRSTDVTTALTTSLVRAGANSMVVFAGFDFGASSAAGYSFTPTVANDREHTQHSPNYTTFVADFGDQGTAGTTSYGVAGVTLGATTKIALEIKGGVSTATGPVPMAQPGRTWLRQFHHRLAIGPPPPVPPVIVSVTASIVGRGAAGVGTAAAYNAVPGRMVPGYVTPGRPGGGGGFVFSAPAIQVPPAQPGRTWLRRFHHRQQPPDMQLPSTAPVAATASIAGQGAIGAVPTIGAGDTLSGGGQAGSGGTIGVPGQLVGTGSVSTGAIIGAIGALAGAGADGAQPTIGAGSSSSGSGSAGGGESNQASGSVAGTGLVSPVVPIISVRAAIAGAGAGVAAASPNLTNNFEGGTNGVTLAQGAGGNTGSASGNYFDTVATGTGATVAFDSTRSAHGTLSCQIATTGTAVAAFVAWQASLGSHPTVWFRQYHA